MCFEPRTAGRPSVIPIGGAVFSTAISRIRSHDSAGARARLMRVRLFAHRVEPFDNGMYIIADDRGDAILTDPSRGEREARAPLREHGLKVPGNRKTHRHQDP